jgi:pyrimidine-nucleoside phosphorylase
VIPNELIEAKRDGRALPAADLEAFLLGYLAGEVPDYQASAFLMATFFRGLDADETDVLVRTMWSSGASLDLSHLPGPRVDKHSTGGVGDKVSLVLAPLAAALGLFVPMMSGRGLGHTTGTLDKLEAIPGFRTGLALDEFERVVAEVGCGMIGQTAEIAPLDRKLYALRDVTGTVPVIPLIAASIMSKKLAEGLTGLLLDVKVGEGAFIPDEGGALTLAERMVAIGAQHGLGTRALLTAMDRPLGLAIGNGLETAEAIACLRGEGPDDLRALVVEEAAEMLVLGDPAVGLGEARLRAEAALDDGRGLERFVRLVEAQGGDAGVVDDPERLRTAPVREEVRAARAGVVTGIRPRPLGEAVIALGGGRTRVDQDVDRGVGFELTVRPDAEVRAGALLGVVHARSSTDAALGARVLADCVTIGETGSKAALRPLVSHRIG